MSTHRHGVNGVHSVGAETNVYKFQSYKIGSVVTHPENAYCCAEAWSLTLHCVLGAGVMHCPLVWTTNLYFGRCVAGDIAEQIRVHASLSGAACRCPTYWSSLPPQNISWPCSVVATKHPACKALRTKSGSANESAWRATSHDSRVCTAR